MRLCPSPLRRPDVGKGQGGAVGQVGDVDRCVRARAVGVEGQHAGGGVPEEGRLRRGGRCARGVEVGIGAGQGCRGA